MEAESLGTAAVRTAMEDAIRESDDDPEKLAELSRYCIRISYDRPNNELTGIWLYLYDHIRQYAQNNLGKKGYHRFYEQAEDKYVF